MGVIPKQRILEHFGLDPLQFQADSYGSGHINSTLLLRHESGEPRRNLILQRLNTHVFRQPEVVFRNHRLAADYLKRVHPDYYFLAPLKGVDNEDFAILDDEYWRILPFVPHAVALNQADSPRQAYEAAKQFGRLAVNLSGIPLEEFKPSIPNFHNLTLRYSDFQSSIQQAPEDRLLRAEELVEAFQSLSGIAVTFETLKTDSGFRDRILHHDSKINNVLLDEQTYQGICVIDLDTLMPGKIISDLGDMVRTYVCAVSEEGTDFGKISIRDTYYEALMKGYLGELGDDLSPIEREVLFYAGQFMIYMQGIRFLTDYLNMDIYYPVKHPEHNFNRAKNQLVLLQQLNKREKFLQQIIKNCL